MNKEQILCLHAKRYDCMQPTDAVKLLYQGVFGGGHLITDEQRCLDYIKYELSGVEADESLPLTEPLGDGLVRVNLAAMGRCGISPEKLCDVFVRSAQMVHGEMDVFLERLDLLRGLAAEGIFGFDTETLEEYLTPYIAAGCPMVSHSEQYRQAYRPAYRVVLENLLEDK